MTSDQIAVVLAAERPDLEIERPYNTLSDWEKGCSDSWNTMKLAFAIRLDYLEPGFDRQRFLERCYA